MCPEAKTTHPSYMIFSVVFFVFMHKTAETFVKDNASQVHNNLMHRPKSTKTFARCDFDSETISFTLRKKTLAVLRIQSTRF